MYILLPFTCYAMNNEPFFSHKNLQNYANINFKQHLVIKNNRNSLLYMCEFDKGFRSIDSTNHVFAVK